MERTRKRFLVLIVVCLATAATFSKQASADTWEKVDGCAADIAVSGPGNVEASVWVTRCGDGLVHKLVDGRFTVVGPPLGTATNIAIDRQGFPWVVKGNGQIWKRESSDVAGGEWKRHPGCAHDIGIGVGNDGHREVIWVTGCDTENIYKWNGTDWERSTGRANRIAVNSFGIPWVVQAPPAQGLLGGPIWRKEDQFLTSIWHQLPGSGQDIAIGLNTETATANAVWVIGGDSGVYQWQEETRSWRYADGTGYRIAVGAAGVWVVNRDGEIFRRR